MSEVASTSVPDSSRDPSRASVPEAVPDPPLVELREVDLGHGVAPVLTDLNVRIGRAEVVTIIGGSGAGKSTILRTITGLLPPLRGTVSLFGEDLYARAPEHRGPLLSRTGLLFQHDALFGSMSLLENVMFPVVKLTDVPQPVACEMARIKLELLGVGNLADRMPADVSGGQRKRAALARATVLDPELVLCDEPTAGLDPVNTHTLARMLVRLRDTQDITVVVVTHDMQTVQEISDRTLVVDDGRITANAPPQQLERSDDARVRAFFERELEPPPPNTRARRSP